MGIFPPRGEGLRGIVGIDDAAFELPTNHVGFGGVRSPVRAWKCLLPSPVQGYGIRRKNEWGRARPAKRWGLCFL